MTLTVVTRELWRASEVDFGGLPLTLPVSQLFYSCTRSDPCVFKGDCKLALNDLQVRAIMQHKIGEIRYNFLVGGDGKVYEGRGWKFQPHLPPKYRHLAATSIYVGFVGTFNKLYCPDEMVETDREFIEFHLAYGYISRKYLEYNLDERMYFVT